MPQTSSLRRKIHSVRRQARDTRTAGLGVQGSLSDNSIMIIIMVLVISCSIAVTYSIVNMIYY